VGKQELEIRIGNDHIAFEVSYTWRLSFSKLENILQTAKIGSLVDIEDSEDPEGLRVFYYLIQDLRVRLISPCSVFLQLNFIPVFDLVSNFIALPHQTHIAPLY
jgi:protein mago nashi